MDTQSELKHINEQFVHKNYIERDFGHLRSDFSEFAMQAQPQSESQRLEEPAKQEDVIPNENETSERDLQWSNTEVTYGSAKPVFEEPIYPVLTKTNLLKIQTGKMPYEVPTAPPTTFSTVVEDSQQNLKIYEMYKTSKINEFLSEKKKLNELLAHYTKIKNRWTRADSTIKITGITLGFLLTCCSICIAPLSTLGFGTVVIVTSSVAGGISALDLFLTETISIGITSKKKKIYREICQCLELGINKLYLYQIKALSDDNLTNEEIESSKKIIEEIKRSCEAIKETYKKKPKHPVSKYKSENLKTKESNETLRLKAEAKKEILNELKRL